VVLVSGEGGPEGESGEGVRSREGEQHLSTVPELILAGIASPTSSGRQLRALAGGVCAGLFG
jgi:hypothetical protein